MSCFLWLLCFCFCLFLCYQNGVLLRTVLDRVTGDLSDTRTRQVVCEHTGHDAVLAVVCYPVRDLRGSLAIYCEATTKLFLCSFISLFASYCNLLFIIHESCSYHVHPFVSFWCLETALELFHTSSSTSKYFLRYITGAQSLKCVKLCFVCMLSSWTQPVLVPVCHLLLCRYLGSRAVKLFNVKMQGRDAVSTCLALLYCCEYIVHVWCFFYIAVSFVRSSKRVMVWSANVNGVKF